ncbi:MAG: flavodoxin [Pirellulales bacterium]
MSLTMAIFYGSSTGNTQTAAEKIQENLGEWISLVADVAKCEPADMLPYDVLFLGVSTWNIGEMQDDWAAFIPRMKDLNLSGKKVAFFCLGDAVGYPYNFLDAMGELWGVVKGLGATLVGTWPCAGYQFQESLGKFDDDNFLGLGLDEENESDQHDERIQTWLVKVLQEVGVLEAPA